MTTADESPSQEVRSPNQGFLRIRTTIRLGAWNVRTHMFETSKTAQVINEMQTDYEDSDERAGRDESGETQAKARDRSVWRSFVTALCPRRDEEDE